MILKHFSSLFCLHFYCVPAFSACIPIASGGKESLISQPLHFYWMYCSPAGLLCPSTFLCAHPYRIPALDCVHFYHVQELPVCICISSSTFLCAHPYRTPALHACTSTIFKQFMCAFLCSLNIFLCAHPYCTPALHACTSITFKQFLCAFLQYSSTGCVHSTFFLYALPPFLYVVVCVVLNVFVCVCMRLYEGDICMRLFQHFLCVLTLFIAFSQPASKSN